MNLHVHVHGIVWVSFKQTTLSWELLTFNKGMREATMNEVVAN